jgi:hypothetical protein
MDLLDTCRRRRKVLQSGDGMIFFVFFSLCGYEIPKKNVLVELRYLRGLTGVYVESS